MEKRAAWAAQRAETMAMGSVALWGSRNFSRRTIDALTAHGIDMPERLLFAVEADLRAISGIAKLEWQRL
jgi:hypothetical protein